MVALSDCSKYCRFFPNAFYAICVEHSERLVQGLEGMDGNTGKIKMIAKWRWMKFSGWFLVLLCLAPGCFQRQEPMKEVSGERVVSLAPSLTEIICAIGAGKHLVGRTSACDYPPDIVKTVPVIGGFGKPSMDSMLNVKPTIVLDVDLEDEHVGKLIEQVGIKRERVKCSSLNDIPRAILTIGNLLHYDKPAHELAETISRRIKELRAAAESSKASPNGVPSVFVEIWGDPLMTAGRQSFLSDIITLAGGRNIGNEINKEYFPVSPEWAILRDPEVIVCLYMTNRANVRDMVNARTGWAQVKAVRNHRVYGGLDNNLILRPGPRVLEGISLLRQCIYEKK